jgi:hypothetical protein
MDGVSTPWRCVLSKSLGATLRSNGWGLLNYRSVAIGDEWLELGQSRGLFSFVFNASAPSGCGLMHRYTGMCDIRGVKRIPLYGVNLLCLTLDAVHKFFRRLRVTTDLCTASAILNFVRRGILSRSL